MSRTSTPYYRLIKALSDYTASHRDCPNIAAHGIDMALYEAVATEEILSQFYSIITNRFPQSKE